LRNLPEEQRNAAIAELRNVLGVNNLGAGDTVQVEPAMSTPSALPVGA
jgi:hypothetical protein